MTEQSHFHSQSQVERAYRFQPAELLDLALEIRNIVARVSPSATERIGARGLTYYDAARGGTIKGGICFVEFRRDRIRLAFGLGAFLDDPKSLLKGDRLAKRYMDVSSFDEAPWADIEDLIQASAAQDASNLNPE